MIHLASSGARARQHNEVETATKDDAHNLIFARGMATTSALDLEANVESHWWHAPD